MGKYRVLDAFFDRIFRDSLNANFDDIDTDIQGTKTRVDNIVANAGSGNTEIVDARQATDGTVYPTLRQHMDDIHGELTQKVTKGTITGMDLDTSSDGNRIKLINLSDEVLQAMAGTTPVNATPGPGSVTTDKIAPKAVTPEMTSFLKSGQNLFNKGTAIAGQYVYGATDGHVGVNSPYSDSYYASDWIQVKPNTTYIKKTPGYYAVYDSNKAWISGESSGNTVTFTTGANAAYVRMSSTSANLATEMLIEGSALPSTFVPFGYELSSAGGEVYTIPGYTSDAKLATEIGKVNDSLNGYAKLKTSQNLFNKATAIANQYVYGGSDGHVGANGTYSNGYYASDFIPVQPNTQYTWKSGGYWAAYDINKVRIAGENASSTKTYTTPANAAYMKISSTSPDTEMFVQGSALPAAYIQYQYTVYAYDNAPLTMPAIDAVNSTLKNVAKMKVGTNLFNKATAIANQYVFGNSDGHVGANGTYSNGYYASDFIPVQPSTQYAWKSGGFWAVYDSNKTFITGEGPTSTKTYTTPANAAYMRISSSPGNLDTEMFVQGSVIPSTYSAFAYNLVADDGTIVFTPVTAAALSRWNGKKVLAIGDSLTAALKWQSTVASLHGCTVTTHAKGGIGLVAMVDGDGAATSPIAALTVADVTGQDLIILFGGMNERSTVYGQLGDVYPTNNTLYGKMQYVINKLYSLLQQANNLTCKILIVTPHCCGKYGYIDVDGYGEYPSGTGQTLEKLGNNLKTCANYNNLRVVDLWHNSGVGKNTWSVYMASSTATLATPDNTLPYPNNADQVHFNDTGYARIGRVISEEMNLI